MSEIQVFIIISVIMGLFTLPHTFHKFKNSNNKSDEFGFGIFKLLLVGFGGGLIVTIISLRIYSEFADKVEIKKHYLNIYSVNREKDVVGNFVLGSGVIETKNYYYFYYKSVYGYKLSKIEATNTYIVESSDRPHIVEVVYKYDNNKNIIKMSDSDPIRYIMYVPKKTIVKNFKI